MPADGFVHMFAYTRVFRYKYFKNAVAFDDI